MSENTTLSPVSRLPVELWSIVFSYLPHTTTRAFSYLSRLFYNLAAPHLFATIRLQFGFWEAAYDPMRNLSTEERDRACELSRMLLDKINQDALFASYIKYLYILAFDPLEMEQMQSRLVQALQSLHNLRSFRWYTVGFPSFAVPSDTLLNTLAAYCPDLRECALPPECIDAIGHWEQLHSIRLSLHIPHEALHLDELPGRPPYVQFQASLSRVLTVHAGHSLTHLNIPGYAAWHIPTSALRCLKHLGLRQATGLENITLLFDHCVALESLWISSRDDWSETIKLLDALAAHPDALPDLTNLKLSLSVPPDGDDTLLEKLAAFLLPKRKLRCLDWSEPWGDIVLLSPLLAIISALPQLEVFGLDVTCDDEDAVEMFRSGMLSEYIPFSLTALRLWVDYVDGEAPISSSLNDLLASLERLAFLWLDDSLVEPLAQSLELAESAPSLVLLGHRDEFCDVLRTDEGATLGPPWSSTKAVFRSVDDIGCADWDWLMQGHSHTIRKQIRRRRESEE